MYSIQFQDIYFNSENGPAETRYVFLEANGLKIKLQDNTTLKIGELGFGTGLNFLETYKLWLSLPEPKAELHYFSIEKFPIPIEQLQTIHADFKLLAAHYPPLLRGFHKLELIPNRIYLYLLFGDVKEMLPQIEGPIDVWFLDGFAPSKNEAMWDPAVLKKIAERSNLNTSLSTFSAAGMVKRNLEAVGFAVKKIKGFGHKREMITATYTKPYISPIPSWFSKPIINKIEKIAIIGAGLAGLMTAYQLQQQGFQVEVFEQTTSLPNHQCQNPAMILRPYLSPNLNFFDQYLTQGYLGMRRFIEDKIPAAIITEAEDACVVNPEILAEFLMQGLSIHSGKIMDPFELKTTFDHVIITTGQFLDFGKPAPGQVTILPGDVRPLFYEGGYCIPDGKGHVLLGSSFRHDASLEVHEKDHEYNLANLSKANPPLAASLAQENREAFVGMRYTTNDHLPIIGGLPIQEAWLKAYDRLRFGDKRPFYPNCPYYEGIYVNLAHGSKGLASSFMASQILLALLSNRPLPIGIKLWDALHPARFWLRSLIRTK